MPFDSVQNLVRAVTDSGLLEPAQQEELVEKLQANFTEPWSLAEYLVRYGWLTIFQLQQLSEGGQPLLMLGPYRILDRLGEGGVSQVYKAWHTQRKYAVALKVIHQEYLSNTEVVGRFHREMHAVARLSHPNIVKAFDVKLNGAKQYFAMEYVEGIDLGKLVRFRGPLSVWESCDYIRQAALGLEHIHESGLVHRDIKPANLLVSMPSSVIKILDLGLARLRRESEGEAVDPLTQEGIMIGTPDYLAPEQAKDPRGVDIRADIYSLGCTFYYLLIGQPPFPGGSLLEKLRNHQLKQPTRTDLVRPGVKEGLAAILEKMMAKDPAERYQTPAEVAAALQSFCTQAHAGTPAPS